MNCVICEDAGWDWKRAADDCGGSNVYDPVEYYRCICQDNNTVGFSQIYKIQHLEPPVKVAYKYLELPIAVAKLRDAYSSDVKEFIKALDEVFKLVENET